MDLKENIDKHNQLDMINDFPNKIQLNCINRHINNENQWEFPTK